MEFLRGFSAFLDYRYWFNLHPVPLGPTLVSSLLSFFVWFAVAAIILYAAAHAIRKTQPRFAQLARKFASPLLTTGILGLLFLFFTYEQAPVLGMRMWFLFLGIYFLFLVGRLAHYAVIEFPKMRHDDAEKARFRKYLPKKK